MTKFCVPNLLLQRSYSEWNWTQSQILELRVTECISSDSRFPVPGVLGIWRNFEKLARLSFFVSVYAKSVPRIRKSLIPQFYVSFLCFCKNWISVFSSMKISRDKDWSSWLRLVDLTDHECSSLYSYRRVDRQLVFAKWRELVEEILFGISCGKVFASFNNPSLSLGL